MALKFIIKNWKVNATEYGPKWRLFVQDPFLEDVLYLLSEENDYYNIRKDFNYYKRTYNNWNFVRRIALNPYMYIYLKELNQ